MASEVMWDLTSASLELGNGVKYHLWVGQFSRDDLSSKLKQMVCTASVHLYDCNHADFSVGMTVCPI
jgi:hypothetical protein